MKTSLSIMRMFYALLCVVLLTTFTLTTNIGQSPIINLFLGVFFGLVLSLLMIGAEFLIKKTDAAAIGITLLGLFVGFLIGQALLLVGASILDTETLQLSYPWILFLKVTYFLICSYIGMSLAFKGFELGMRWLSHTQLDVTKGSKREFVLDASILSDPRVIDIASSGLLDQMLVLPKFVINEIYTQADISDEQGKNRAKRSIETFKKLEALPELGLRIDENDYPEIKDLQGKLIRLAREHEAAIFTADVNRIQQLTIDGVRFININALSNALKPITQTGEILQIKIQRYGKEPRQGVGYLEDGTMVVVNSGAEYIGETIRAQVLSVKHTASGRMIFCNAADEMSSMINDSIPSAIDLERKPKDYLAL